jgi:hypothetical protein
MKTYNRALDYIALAMVQASKGRPQTAAALFMKASTSPDMQQAVAIIEASNAQAYALKASAQTAKRKAVNAEKQQLAALIGEVPDEEFEEVEADAFEAEEEHVEQNEPIGEPEAVEDEAIGDEEAEEQDEAAQFANALRAAVKKQTAAKKPAKK